MSSPFSDFWCPDYSVCPHKISNLCVSDNKSMCFWCSQVQVLPGEAVALLTDMGFHQDEARSALQEAQVSNSPFMCMGCDEDRAASSLLLQEAPSE